MISAPIAGRCRPLLAVAIAAACGGGSGAAAEQGTETAASVADTVPAAVERPRAEPLPPPDTTAVTFPLAEGRTARDSLALLRVMRLGVRQDWPTLPEPRPGSILPERRIVAFYGNPLETRMGVLGQPPVDEMLERLDREVARWREADPATPVQPALHLVSIVAQGAPGRDGKYRLRMDSTLIERVYGWAQSRNALLFLDVQVGWSTLQEELPTLMRFLRRPTVHLGIDPEFSMHYGSAGVVPGRRIGTFDASDINYAISALAELVERENLPPKILVVHRFTQRMVTNYDRIQLDPRVQVVMHMDGWGPPWLKFDSYGQFIIREPVQYTGFKLFLDHDTRRGDTLLAPQELVRLVPAPLYIQYQ